MAFYRSVKRLYDVMEEGRKGVDKMMMKCEGAESGGSRSVQEAEDDIKYILNLLNTTRSVLEVEGTHLLITARDMEAKEGKSALAVRMKLIAQMV